MIKENPGKTGAAGRVTRCQRSGQVCAVLQSELIHLRALVGYSSLSPTIALFIMW